MQKIKFKNFSIIKIYVFILIIVLFNTCTCNNSKQKVDISDVKVNIKIHRFEQKLFTLSTDDFTNEIVALKKEYPNFLKLYTEDILRLRNTDDSFKVLKSFLTNESIKGLYDTCQIRYNDISEIEEALKTALQYYKYYFPEVSIPEIYTFISEFGFGIITADSILGIGLDMFLGKNYPYYPSIGLPQYLIEKLEKEYLIPTCMNALLRSKYEFIPDEHTLLSEMIYNGKILYCLDLILPDTPGYLKISYTKEQMKWCIDNEINIWSYFVEHELLYETDMLKYRKYINDGPSTPGMPQESPGNIGSFVGWQIIRKFMARNPDVSLKELMGEKKYSGQEILNQSYYKPKKSLL